MLSDSTPSDPARLSIGELARQTGVSAKAIRFYERMGILPAPDRAENGYRRYRHADVNRLLLVGRLRRLGLPLEAVRPLVAGTDAATCAVVRREVLDLIDQRLAAIDREIDALLGLRVAVTDYQRSLAAACGGDATPFVACDDAACLVEPERCAPPVPRARSLLEGSRMIDVLSAHDTCCDCDCDCCEDGCCGGGCCNGKTA